MWQIDWMINLLPTWMFHIIVATGIGLILASWILKRIPFIKEYNFPIHLIGILLTGVGIYYIGGRVNQAEWEAKIKDMEAKVQVAEAKSKEVNTVIETRVVEKVKIVKEKTNANKKIIKEVAGAQLDARCELPVSTVVLVNSASKNEVSGGPSVSDGASSGVKASDLLDTVVENYGKYNEIREKLVAWQEWYKQQKRIFEEVNK
jgi:hypothetical protein